MTIADLVTDALAELVILEPGAAPASELAALGLTRLNQILDNWNADREAVYVQQFTNYTLTPNLAPHTIGPTGTFVVTQRPESIDGGSIIDTTQTPDVKLAVLTMRDAAWWNGNVTPDLTSILPTDLYYASSWPNGALNFWPVPTQAYRVQLETRVVLASVALTDTFTMPPGYQNALTLTLAEDLAAPMGVQASPQTMKKARDARVRVFADNVVVPRLSTRGPQQSTPGRPNFNWLNGSIQ